MDATRLDHLLNHYVDEGLLVDERRELERLLLDSAEARDLFWKKILFHGLIRDYYDVLSGQQDLDSACGCFTADPERMPIPGQIPVDADLHLVDDAPVAIPTNTPSSPLLSSLGFAWHGTVGFFSQEVPFSLLIASVVTALGLWGSSLVYVSKPQPMAKSSRPSISALADSTPHHGYVGQVTGIVDVKWEEGSTTKNLESHISLGDRFALASGLLEITYDTGAKVILQGPVTYQVDSRDGGYLSIGKLTARLEKKQSAISGQQSEPAASMANHKSEIINQKSLASSPQPLAPNSNPQTLIPNPSLFTIKTPTALVTDLGTEFGVEVDAQGTTTSCVYRGSIQLQSISSAGRPEGVAKILYRNESARVRATNDARSIEAIPFVNVPKFVRAIPEKLVKSLDLVDVLAGGDGFSQRRNHGINPTNGLPTDSPPLPDKFFLNGDMNYHRVAGLSFVDGVFIPADKAHPSQIDSAGHTFPDWFEPTCNQTYGYIWAGGKIHSAPGAHLRAVLEGVDYAAPGRGSIFMHANSGITFDLAAIRAAHPQFRIARFVAVAGNAESSSADLGDAGADAWVFVDGKVQFRRRQINYNNGAFAINLPIAKADRFLTLMSSDGNRSIGWDWIVFGDPRLELIEVESGITTHLEPKASPQTPAKQ